MPDLAGYQHHSLGGLTVALHRHNVSRRMQTNSPCSSQSGDAGSSIHQAPSMLPQLHDFMLGFIHLVFYYSQSSEDSETIASQLRECDFISEFPSPSLFLLASTCKAAVDWISKCQTIATRRWVIHTVHLWLQHAPRSRTVQPGAERHPVSMVRHEEALCRS